MGEEQPARERKGEPAKGAASGEPREAAGRGAAPSQPPSPSPSQPSGDFDFALEEIARDDRLKEGFTGQER
jgi:hypothetical protein